MSRKANSTWIGGFVVGAALLVVMGVVYFGSGKFLARKNAYVMYFKGSLAGLHEGAPVNFRGVKIGRVTDIAVQYNTEDDTFRIPVYVETQPDRIVETGGAAIPQDPDAVLRRMLDRGLRAQLSMQSYLTGQLAVMLDFFPETPLELVGGDPKYMEIPTIPRPLEELAKTIASLPLGEIVKDVQSTIQRIEELVTSPELAETLQALNQTLKDFGELARRVDSKVDQLAQSITETAEEAKIALKRTADAIVAAQGSLDETLSDISHLAKNVDGQVEPTLSSFRSASQAAIATLQQAQHALQTVDGVVAEDSELHFSIIAALRELADAAHSIRVLADFLEQHPEALLQGKGDPGGS